MSKTVGIIAGNGRFPILVADEAAKQGYRVVISAIESEADPILEKKADAFSWVKVGELKKLAKFFRSEGVHEAIMAGKVEKVRLFQKNVRPDFEMVKVLMKLKDHKDDSLLGGIATYLHQQGVDLLDSTKLIRPILPGPGALTRKKPTDEILADIYFGFEMAKKIAALDIGQTVIVKKKAMMAVEAIEGTDQAIRRGAELSGGKMTVVKVAKPNQDMRFDVPAIGLKTIETLAECQAEALAFEAYKTLFLDKEECIRLADQKGIVLYGLEGTEGSMKK